MATETVPRLPVIESVQAPQQSAVRSETGDSELPARESEKKDADARQGKAASFMARVQLGTVHKQPRPGDVYRPRTSSGLGYLPPAKQQRPLGLIPDRRERMSLLTELTRLFDPVVPAGFSAPPTAAQMPARQQPLPSIRKPSDEAAATVEVTRQAMEEQNVGENDYPERHNALISATLKWSGEDKIQGMEGTPKQQSHNPPVVGSSASTALLGNCESLSPYRLHRYGTQEGSQQATTDCDPDYLEIFSKCNIKDYYSLLENGSSHRVHRIPQKNGISGVTRKRSHTLPLANAQWSSSPRMTAVLQLSQSKKAAQLSGRTDYKSTTVKYMKFSGQAKLWNKSLTDDRREALGYEPCERCRLKGGRCSKCKAIRTGGGYIILDGLSDDDLQRKYESGMGLGEGYCYGHGANRMRSGGSSKYGPHGDHSGAGLIGSGGGLLGAGDSEHNLRGSTGLGLGRGTGGGRRDGLGALGHGDDDDGRSGEGRDGRLGRNKYGTDKNALGGNSLDGDDNKQGKGLNEDGLGQDSSGEGLKNSKGDQDDSGRYSNMSDRLGSRQSGSRPGSTLGSRPASSLRKLGSRGSSRKDRMRRNIGVERKNRGRGTGEDSDDDGGSDGDGRTRRRRGRGEGSDDEGDGKDRADFKFSSDRRELEAEEDGEGGSLANLMRFKRKRDDVKALHATMKELQGIDPLDYLARYCIIDQSKLPNYQHAYDNVDRDEDDEIDISELDFALKTVNYDLITDAEMNYVHSVLELAGRYKLNFRLFSLIAALSEKVVALEDMVKRLINKMDFEALEVKMKKCKELFYLLADDESSDHDGGVVTTNSLAVELQAGGLTAEHVEFVVDRLNHEDKGIVEFLDYLTYVPLFVEIHDTISGNPLDFSRTK